MTGPDDLRATGERVAALIEQLLAATDGPVRGGIEEVLRLVTDLYGAALTRVVALADPDLLAALVADDLVASLLMVHDLHPETVVARVGAALDEVRPLFHAHGGDVELLDVDAGVVRLRLLGSCDGCPSSADTLRDAVERAVLDAAPELRAIEVDGADPRRTRAVPVALGRREP